MQIYAQSSHQNFRVIHAVVYNLKATNTPAKAMVKITTALISCSRVTGSSKLDITPGGGAKAGVRDGSIGAYNNIVTKK